MIANMIKMCINKGIDDTAKIRRGFYRWLGRDLDQKAQSFVPHGTFGCPTENSIGIAFVVDGKESNVVVLDGGTIERIKTDCKPGEYGIGNTITKSNIYFKEDGGVTFEVPDGSFTVTQKGDYILDIDGNVTVNSTANIDVNSDGDTTIDASEVNFNNGSNGVARLDDSTTIDEITDSTFLTWTTAVSTFINGLAPGTVVPPVQMVGKITSSSSTVKAGD